MKEDVLSTGGRHLDVFFSHWASTAIGARGQGCSCRFGHRRILVIFCQRSGNYQSRVFPYTQRRSRETAWLCVPCVANGQLCRIGERFDLGSHTLAPLIVSNVCNRFLCSPMARVQSPLRRSPQPMFVRRPPFRCCVSSATFDQSTSPHPHWLNETSRW